LAGLGVFLLLLWLTFRDIFIFSFRWYSTSGKGTHGPTLWISPLLCLGGGILLLSLFLGRRRQ